MPAPRPTAAALLLAALALLGCGGGSSEPRLRDGVLDLSSWSFEDQGLVQIEGDWEVCWGSFAKPGGAPCDGPHGGWTTFPAPRLWSDSTVETPIGGHGFATYRMVVKLPPRSERGNSGEAWVEPLALRVGAPVMAYRLWLGGTLVGGSGRPGTTAEATVPRLANREYPFPDDQTSVEVLAHVSNFSLRGGGIRRQWFLGTARQIADRNALELLAYSAFVTTSVVLGLIFLVQFALRPSEKARGWFGLFALSVGLRILPGSASDLRELLLGWLSADALLRLEYINTAALIYIAAAYLRAKVPGVMPPRLTQTLQVAALALIPIQIFAPLPTALATLPLILVIPPLGMILLIWSYGRAWRRGMAGAGTTLVAGMLFALGILHDVIRTPMGIGAPIEIFPYFVVFYMAAESQSLLRSFFRSFGRVEELSEELQDANFELQETEEAVVRFVPFDLLRYLGKDTIRDVRPGDHVEAVMTVVAGNFERAELSASGEGFARAGRVFARIDHEIESRGGFVAQRLAGSFVAFFPDSADDAIDAAVALATLETGQRVDLGIATGPVQIGTVGGQDHLAVVVLGEGVREAKRMSVLAGRSGEGPLLSGSIRDRLGDDLRRGLHAVDLQGGQGVYGLAPRRSEQGGPA